MQQSSWWQSQKKSLQTLSKSRTDAIMCKGKEDYFEKSKLLMTFIGYFYISSKGLGFVFISRLKTYLPIYIS